MPAPAVTVDAKKLSATGADGEKGPKTGKVFDGTNLRKEWTNEWTNACAACGLGRKIEVPGKKYDPHDGGLTLHDLRRSAVRNLINAGVRERVAMQITGHKTRSVFDRYHIVPSDDVTNAMQAQESSSLNADRHNGEKLVKKTVSYPRKSMMALSSRG